MREKQIKNQVPGLIKKKGTEEFNFLSKHTEVSVLETIYKLNEIYFWCNMMTQNVSK